MFKSDCTCKRLQGRQSVNSTHEIARQRNHLSLNLYDITQRTTNVYVKLDSSDKKRCKVDYIYMYM